MVKNIDMLNFMSHAKSSVPFSGTTIAISGQNGSGKSALLEALPYAYYGLGRGDTIQDMSRNKGDGSHSVKVTHDDGVVIKRGCKPSGTGFCTVHVDGALVAKGKEANAWIMDYLGMDCDTYMLTAFFGLKDVRHDTLINVQPASRLETIQRFEDIGPYKAFAAKAKELFKEAEKDYDNAVSRKDVAESILVDIPELEKRLKRVERSEKDLLSEVKVRKATRRDLQVEEEKYQAMVKDQARLSSERKSTRRDIERLEDELEEHQTIIKENDESFADIKIIKADIEKSLKTAKPTTDLLKKAVESEEVTVRMSTLADLRDTAVSVGGNACPLCDAKLDAHTIEKWMTEISEFREIAEYNGQRAVDLRKEVKEITQLRKSLEDQVQQAKRLMDESEASKKKLTELTRELRKLNSELENLDGKYLTVTEKLGDEYQGLQARIAAVSDMLDQTNKDLGEVKGVISGLKESIQNADKGRLAIDKAKVDIKEAKRDMAAYKLLQSAWSRYGIPMSLIQGVMQDIENRASSVYKAFDNGYIEVREVEDRGRPGVQFYLLDRKGERTYNQLSEGEKVIFFVSIRVAISQIVAETGVNVDYLILDEAMGNLDPKRRDELIRLVSKTLKKLFPMVAMVSHTEMRDIFTQTIRVSAENGESKVEVA